MIKHIKFTDFCQHTAKSLELSKGLNVIVGDNTTDIQAAHNAGVKSIAVTSGHGYPSELAAMNPTLLVESVRDLFGHLKNLFPDF